MNSGQAAARPDMPGAPAHGHKSERKYMAVGMKSAEDLVSVIIPVYNVKPYLQMCADTVFAQTFRNLEIIFVDDGSTDGSGEICDELALKDPRVKVIHQENGGLSDARNTGIAASTGSFLYFLDSDDAISPVTIAHLWTACIRTKADVAIGDHVRFSEEKIPEERRNFSSESLNAEEAIRRMLLNQGYTNTAWGKLFRRELWSDMRFPKGLLNEDLAVIYDVMVQVKKAVVVKDALYFYRVRKGSIMTSKIGERNLPLLDTSERVTNMLIEHYPSLRGPAIRLQVVLYMRFLSDLLETDYRMFPDVQKRIISTLKKYRREFMRSPDVRKVDKLKLASLLAGKRAFYLLYKVSDSRK
ncbi:MAG: glycosyltransferase [Lachnospiraceae bacterium]|nr:glycosyltransferase [Lachnospiraceae bacterium]